MQGESEGRKSSVWGLALSWQDDRKLGGVSQKERQRAVFEVCLWKMCPWWLQLVHSVHALWLLNATVLWYSYNCNTVLLLLVCTCACVSQIWSWTYETAQPRVLAELASAKNKSESIQKKDTQKMSTKNSGLFRELCKHHVIASGLLYKIYI